MSNAGEGERKRSCCCFLQLCYRSEEGKGVLGEVASQQCFTSCRSCIPALLLPEPLVSPVSSGFAQLHAPYVSHYFVGFCCPQLPALVALSAERNAVLELG